MRSIRVFPEFLVDPYYEPLAWFMIVAIVICLMFGVYLVIRQDKIITS